MNKVFLLLLLIVICACKSTDKNHDNVELNEIEKIAQADGITAWDSVKTVSFKFSVGKMGRELYARNWKWNRQTSQVTLTAPPDTVSYYRYEEMDSIQTSADRAFVNDIYWLIPQIKLATDRNVAIEESPVKTVAPISKDSLNTITMVYSDTGGYTPGDAYDLYYNDDYELKEWVYRQKNDTITSMMTTFNKPIMINGIKVATDHRTPDRMTRILLSNIEFTK